MKLYIAGYTARSTFALSNLKKLTSELPDNAYKIEVIDLLTTPEKASIDAIIAIPTTVRSDCVPIRKVVGDLSDVETARVTLDIHEPYFPD